MTICRPRLTKAFKPGEGTRHRVVCPCGHIGPWLIKREAEQDVEAHKVRAGRAEP